MIRLLAIWLVSLYMYPFYRLRVYGKKHFPKGGGLICSNHTSFLDPPLVGITSPGVVHFLGRDTLFQSPFFGWLIRNLNCHPVKRGKGNANAFKLALQLIRQGRKVVIFPEGSRSPDGELHEGQLGVGMLVHRTNCQVVPVYVDGTYDIWNTERRLPKVFGKIACVFGAPLTFEDLQGVDKRQAHAEIVERIMAKIAELRDWYKAGAKGLPP